MSMFNHYVLLKCKMYDKILNRLEFISRKQAGKYRPHRPALPATIIFSHMSE